MVAAKAPRTGGSGASDKDPLGTGQTSTAGASHAASTPQASEGREPSSLVTQAWRTGAGPRLALMIGGAVSVTWGVLAVVVTVRFLLNTVTNSALPWPIKAFAVVVVPVVMLFLVVSVPVNWLMYVLDRLLNRHR
ncbi:MAG: hypothetical protein OER90_06500 [Gemmatimonadota bacterium]|nr:hypothetical protein [Gemmatimonadota bacterium]